MAQPDSNTNSVTVKLSPKGKYYWEITLTPFLDNSTVVEQLKDLDSKLQTTFPKNSLSIHSQSRFSEVDDVDF